MLAARAGRWATRSISRTGWATRRFSGAVGSHSAVFMDELYDKWQADKKSVDDSWNTYFQELESGTPSSAPVFSGSHDMSQADTVKILHLVRAYQVRGHELADLDPLGLAKKPSIPELSIARYGFSEADLDRRLNVQELAYATFSGILAAVKKNEQGQTTLREIVRLCERVYCGTVGFDFMHIPNRTQCVWLREKIERAEPLAHDKEWRRRAFERLAFSERFEAFLANKWSTAKRFGIEGNDSMVPGLKAAIDTAKANGVTHVIIGMAHRGRMNVIVNVMRKPAEQVFREFAGTQNDGNGVMWTGSGDVKYHLGFSHDRYYEEGNLHMTLLANPSHLEAVNTVVAGKARAKMHFLNDDGTRVMPVVIHGDAAFAGQGICYEHMQLSQLTNYKTGGTLHICCNNQVGFTTDPSDARSTLYATDLAKTFNCPVFHVNADDVERVCEVFQLAAEWRQRWRTDVVVDLVGYRKFGHNEMDQPMFTQPLVYRAVAAKMSPLNIQKKKLLEEKVFSEEELKAIEAKADTIFEEAYKLSKTVKSNNNLWLADTWSKMVSPRAPLPPDSRQPTGVPPALLQKVGQGLTNFPEGFVLHKQVAKIMEAKRDTVTAGKGIDWGTAEALAFGTLLQEGIHVRLSGEDVERGTFSHRHAVVHDQNTGEKFCALKHIPGNQQAFVVCNSPLSEYGVLGFDLGYSMESPYQLVLWEAQFGDFVNGAQIIIDEFLSAGEAKWLRQMGLVMLLPHGYDGQGPDHSSARIERFLGAADEDVGLEQALDLDPEVQIQRSNWQVVNVTTPANYFHVLRRQVKRAFRKPLIVASPKQLLKLKECSSSLADFALDSKFHRIFDETFPQEVESDPKKIRRLLWCSGKIYYELLAQRRADKLKDVAICRVEQIHPFPFQPVKDTCAKYPNAEIVWAQEEPRNMGCWAYVNDRLIAAAGGTRKIGYVGRPSMASTAEGLAKEHKTNQENIIKTSLSSNVMFWGHHD